MRLAVIVINNISNPNVKNPVAIGTSVESTQVWTGFGIESTKYFLYTDEEVDSEKFKRRINRHIHRIEDYKASGEVIGTIKNGSETLEIQVRTVH